MPRQLRNFYSRGIFYRINILLVVLFVNFHTTTLRAQDSTGKIYQGVLLDEVMIKSVRLGQFDMKGFLKELQNDTTFYKAFKTLHLFSYSMMNDIEILDKKDRIKASYNSIARQKVANHCRTMELLHEKTTGNFFNTKGEYQYYTPKLYAHLFFTKGKICNENNIVGRTIHAGSTKYEEQLRTLIFNPGTKIRGIPGIGENMAIYQEPYFSYYDFSIKKQLYNGDTCYYVKAIPKEDYAGEVVINRLETWVRTSDRAIVARNYNLSYRTWIYDFNVDMQVKLLQHKKEWVPYFIQYSGNWHALTKNREISTFTATFSDFD